ncbi:MAG: coenzyme F430 synthase [Candidatus Alkanophagales archaeon]
MRLRELRGKDVLVVDMTHGGTTLTEALLERCASVTAADIYGTLSEERREALERLGVEVKRSVDDAASYDFIFSPVHSPVLNPMTVSGSPDARGRGRDWGREDRKIVSHHELVGALLEEKKPRARIVEVTGVKGKTSTAFFLFDIFKEAGIKALMSSSLGVFYGGDGGERRLRGKADITPANVLSVLELAEGLEVEVFIFEISLGFTGAADASVLTTLEPDYKIAAGRLSAAAAKLFTASRCKNIVLSRRAYERYRAFRRNGGRLATVPQTLLYDDPKTWATLPDAGEEAPVCFEDVRTEFFSNPRISAGYVENALAAAFTSLLLGVSPSSVRGGLRKCRGVPGRMRCLRRGNAVFLEDANPALDAASLENAMRRALSIKGAMRGETRLIVVLGGDGRGSCSQLRCEEVADVVRRFEGVGVEVFLVGEVGRRLRELGVAGTLLTEEEMSELTKLGSGVVLFALRGADVVFGDEGGKGR